MVPLRLSNVTESKCILNLLRQLLFGRTVGTTASEKRAQEALTVGISSFEIVEQFVLQVSLTVSR